MAEEKGMKELLEVVDLVEALALKVIPAVADGVQLDDIKVLFDQELFDKAKKAVDDIGMVGDEIKDISWAEGAMLAPRMLMMVQGIVAALEKEKKEA